MLQATPAYSQYTANDSDAAYSNSKTRTIPPAVRSPSALPCTRLPSPTTAAQAAALTR